MNAPSETFPPATPNDVLIVDDNPENLKVLGDFFAAQGFNVRVARDGEQALANVAEATPEVILLDIHMPVMDGYETCRRLKAMPALTDTPVIFLSALGETFNKLQAFECGGADYITKPFNIDEVRVRVNNHLQTARLLAESKAGFRATFEQAAVGMAHLDKDGRFIAVNDRLCKMLGHDQTTLTRMRLHDFVRPCAGPSADDILNQTEAPSIDRPPVEFTGLNADGKEIACRATISPVTVPATGNRYIATIFEDVTEHKEAVEERRRLAAALEQTAEPVAVTDIEGVTQYVNPAYETTFDVRAADLVGKPLPIIARTGDGDAVATEIWDTLSKGGAWSGRVTKSSGDQKPRTEEYTVSPVRDANGAVTNYVAIVRDLTQQLWLEEQLRQSQKMEAIGTLAAGIAHDFNNLLSVIIGFTQLTLDDMPEEHPNRNDLQEVLNASTHATDLVRQILAFSRQSAFMIRPVHLQQVGDEALKLLRRSIPPSIEIHKRFDPKCPPVLADATSVHQIFMNLCTNAYHAMKDRHGVLTVRLAEFAVDGEIQQLRRDLPAGHYVRLDVIDTGHGMDAATVQRIFDPYFTTKERGSGTGLGLATVHGIVRDLKGAVTVYSEPGEGSTFTVLLPAAPAEAVPEREPSAPPCSLKGVERVLVVDDEPAICEFVARVLTPLGYSVEACEKPVEALENFRAKPDAYDVVVTDELMPELRGGELLAKLRAIRPDVPAVLYSGFAESIRNQCAGNEAFNAYLMKPASVPELTAAIRAALASVEAPD